MSALGSARVSKKTWYANGGFSNPRCWRRQKGGAWMYFMRYD
jgi:hypothetical protein